MAKILIPENLKGKELFKFLIDNKKSLIAEKKSEVKRCDPVSGLPSYYRTKGEKAEKTVIGDIPEDASSIFVKVVGNSAWWCDTQKDVLIPDCWKKSIDESQGKMPHLHDHIFEIEAEVGDVRRVYSQEVSLADLGYNKAGTTQVIIWETDIIKEYNPKIFKRYKEGKINQHSISLRYVRIELAINDEEYEKEMDFWNKYAPYVINQDAIEDGYFWVVQEIKVIENSAVLRGANELTPTLSVSAKFDTGLAPSDDTRVQPPITHSAFDLSKAIKETKFFN
jgi:hypothetical protein